MKIKIIELYSEVEERYNKYKNVIIYLEDSMNKSQMIQSTHDKVLVKAEFDKLTKLHRDFLETHTNEIQPLVEKAKLQALLTFSDALKKFGEDYNKLSFLK